MITRGLAHIKGLLRDGIKNSLSNIHRRTFLQQYFSGVKSICEIHMLQAIFLVREVYMSLNFTTRIFRLGGFCPSKH